MGTQKKALAKSIQGNHLCFGVNIDKAVYGFRTGKVGVATIVLICLRSSTILYLFVSGLETGKIGVFQSDSKGTNTPDCMSPATWDFTPASGLFLY